jgi:hypothetical protein
MKVLSFLSSITCFPWSCSNKACFAFQGVGDCISRSGGEVWFSTCRFLTGLVQLITRTQILPGQSECIAESDAKGQGAVKKVFSKQKSMGPR